jgi:GT2 family glycosyltransferase
MEYPLVSVIILNWNGDTYAEESIASILKQEYPEYELIVVDNGSTDSSLQTIRDRFKNKLCLIENEKNKGFAAGSNAGIRRSRGKYVALLNNDAVADSSWLKELVAIAEAELSAGMCASKVLNYFERDIIDTAGHLAYRDGLNRGRGRLQKDKGQYDKVEEVFFPSGAAALYRKAMLDEIGLFDEDFFAYGEDADIGFRGRLMGWRCLYVPTAIAYHRYSAGSSAYSPMKAFLVERNRIWVALKNFPLPILALSPLYTFKRYCMQAYAAIFKKGAAGRFASKYSGIYLLWILFAANLSALSKIFSMCKKRRQIKKMTRVGYKEISSWFRNFAISAEELSFKD